MRNDTKPDFRVLDLSTKVAELTEQVERLASRNRRLVALAREGKTENQCGFSDCLNVSAIEGQSKVCDSHLRDIMITVSQKMSTEHRAKVASIPANRVDELVYYIRMGGRIKIGRSTNLKKRMATFHAQPDQLLAVEPCIILAGMNRETQRHHEFAYCRVNGTELFLPTEELEAHIQDVVEAFGDPSRFI